jgi:hypothetical protein
MAGDAPGVPEISTLLWISVVKRRTMSVLTQELRLIEEPSVARIQETSGV